MAGGVIGHGGRHHCTRTRMRASRPCETERSLNYSYPGGGIVYPRPPPGAGGAALVRSPIKTMHVPNPLSERGGPAQRPIAASTGGCELSKRTQQLTIHAPPPHALKAKLSLHRASAYRGRGRWRSRNKTTERDIADPALYYLIGGDQIKGFAVAPRPGDPRQYNNHLCIKSNCVFKFGPYNARGMRHVKK
ncbi:hypothetical protein EVAR_66445_1 [Eumeta japonica]|uniref:Uncharacterized protein n=1 Tax=Eumeta variegata TaxID=151549 RepID=A0A4C2A4A6_EUMVA|nr:hypothetical protein EVAR_66445_1 [Eumeta japonica]